MSGRPGRSSARRNAPQTVPQDVDVDAYARGLVLDSLSRAARTRGQLARTLARKGVPEDVAESVLDRYAELGLVDDAAFAEAFTRSRHEYKGLGSRAIAFELRRREVPDELVREAVAALDSEQEQETASRLARQRAARMANLPREVQARRLAAFLARKGHGGQVVGRAVREALENAGGDGEFDFDDVDDAEG